MEEKIYNLLEKMYTEFSNRFDKVESDISNAKETMATKEELSKVSQTVARIEIEHGEKLNALLDGYKQHSDQLCRIEEKVETIFEQVGNHEVQIKLLKK